MDSREIVLRTVEFTGPERVAGSMPPPYWNDFQNAGYALKGFSSESNKLHYIANNRGLLSEKISFKELILLLRQFGSESNRLAATGKLVSLLPRPSGEDLENLLSLFDSESNKHRAIEMVR